MIAIRVRQAQEQELVYEEIYGLGNAAKGLPHTVLYLPYVLPYVVRLPDVVVGRHTACDKPAPADGRRLGGVALLDCLGSGGLFFLVQCALLF